MDVWRISSVVDFFVVGVSVSVRAYRYRTLYPLKVRLGWRCRLHSTSLERNLNDVILVLNEYLIETNIDQ